MKHFTGIILVLCMQIQDEKYEARSVVAGEQMSTDPVFQQPFRQFPVSSQKPIDLSCNEMDVSLDCGTTPADHPSVTDEMGDSQGTRNSCCYGTK